MRARGNGIEIEYETFGDEGAAPLVLVAGFAQQLIRWDDAFCVQLARRGFRVVRFDNRDVGLSTKLQGAPRLNLPAIFGGDRSTVPYSIEDMADDTAGLIESLGLGSTHMVGVSMGGMIVQSLAIRHPGRVKSLASIMSTTGDPRVGQPSPEALATLMRPVSRDRAENIENGVLSWRTLRSPAHPFDTGAVREYVTRAYDRSFYPAGVARQLAAILSQADRTAALGGVTVPTVVIHGADDPLIHVSGGEATARAIPNARLQLIAGMGHDMPEGLFGTLIDAITENAQR
jgi:pimeloyl-ACP methyl ester carboxylesterase